MAFQTVSATQKQSKNGGQTTAIISDTKIGNYCVPCGNDCVRKKQ